MLETETTEEPMIIGDIKMLISPTNPPVLSQDPPLVQVTLDHAYGFRCFDTR